MMVSQNPAPRRDAVVDESKHLSAIWDRWFARLETWMKAVGSVLGSVGLTSQAAAISATSVPLATLRAGLYVVSYYIRLTRAATTSSSLQVTLSWVDGGVTCQKIGAALTGNTTATQESGSIMVRADAASAIQYAVAYASVGATSAQFSLDVVVEEAS